ncbi:hypothetical protein ACP179_23775 (plasmid) [Xenorhabdus stockiae]|uniref:hypothetical protein n=1 Tax=Xenorhabdus stockiae TaxID=351614 RepID=UPI003CFAB951
MTTVIHIDNDFVACDGKWASDYGRLCIDDHTVYKYLYFKEKIAFFAGSEYPIVSRQARLKNLITDEEFIERSVIQSELSHEIEWLVININDGAIVGGDSSNLRGINKLGSGGDYAANFFHYAKKAKYRSYYSNNVIGALRYACYKDPVYTGDPMTIKSWNQKYPIDTTKNNDHTMYEYQLRERLRELDRGQFGYRKLLYVKAAF